MKIDESEYVRCPYCYGEGYLEFEEMVPFWEHGCDIPFGAPVPVIRREQCHVCLGLGTVQIEAIGEAQENSDA